MKILLLDNYDSFTFNLYHLLEKVCDDADISVVRNDKITIDEAGKFDAIVFSPGPGIPSEAGLMPAIIQAYKYTKPLLGVCLGHQAIAESFGYRLKNLSRVYHGVSSLLSVTDGSCVLFHELPLSFNVGRYHSWVVDEMSSGELLVTARSEDGEIMAFRHRLLPVYGVQFHPESILSENGDVMLKNWYRALRSEVHGVERESIL